MRWIPFLKHTLQQGTGDYGTISTMERFYQLNDDCLINQRSSVESPHAGYKRLKKWHLHVQ